MPQSYFTPSPVWGPLREKGKNDGLCSLGVHTGAALVAISSCPYKPGTYWFSRPHRFQVFRQKDGSFSRTPTGHVGDIELESLGGDWGLTAEEIGQLNGGN